MESLDELAKGSGSKPSFFKHVFNFDEDSKAEMMNIVQYALLALIPVIILNKLMNRFVPEADDAKGSPEIVFEVLAQIIVLFILILIIHRIITFVPTYSGEKYADFSVTNIIMVTLIIVLSLQTKLGEKVSILMDRITELWEGPKDDKKKGKKNSVKVSQPISQGQQAMSQSLGSTSISSLPTAQPTQQLPDYNSMYQHDPTPLVGAATPGVDSFVPMAANDAIGSAFGSSFGGLF